MAKLLTVTLVIWLVTAFCTTTSSGGCFWFDCNKKNKRAEEAFEVNKELFEVSSGKTVDEVAEMLEFIKKHAKIHEPTIVEMIQDMLDLRNKKCTLDNVLELDDLSSTAKEEPSNFSNYILTIQSKMLRNCRKGALEFVRSFKEVFKDPEMRLERFYWAIKENASTRDDMRRQGLPGAHISGMSDEMKEVVGTVVKAKYPQLGHSISIAAALDSIQKICEPFKDQSNNLEVLIDMAEEEIDRQDELYDYMCYWNICRQAMTTETSQQERRQVTEMNDKLSRYGLDLFAFLKIYNELQPLMSSQESK